MRVLGLSLVALHLARAAVRGDTLGDSQHELLPDGIAVASRRRGTGTRLLRHDSAAADRAEATSTETRRQTGRGITLERDEAREDKVEEGEDAATRGLDTRKAEAAPDRRQGHEGHHMTLETLRGDAGTGEDAREESATAAPPPPSPGIDLQTGQAGEAGDGAHNEGLPRNGEGTAGISVAAGGEGGGGGDGNGGDGDGTPLERCFSSPAADPSDGAWKECPGGEEECSPTRATAGNWAGQWGTGFHRCTALWETQHPERGSRPYWRWEPEKCRLDEVTADGFCSVMEGRKGLLLVGDSLTRLFTLTLAATVGARQVRSSKFASDLFLACGDSLRVMHYRNDLLDTRVEEFPSVHCVEPDYGSTRCTRFADDATLEQYDTLVVNSGAHVVRAGMAAYADLMSQASSTLTASMRRLHGDEAILVVRNTPPGHWNCEELMFHGPVDMETATNLIAQSPPLYEWETFSLKNEVLQEAFSAEDGWRLLDAYTPTVLRADGHYGLGDDCLHYCLPGPIDHWLTLLYNILLAEAYGAR